MSKNQAYRRLSVRSLVKQHCYQDLACLHCCQCWIKFKKQYEIKLATLTEKYQKACKQIIFLTNLNKQLNKQLKSCKNSQQLISQIEQIKQKYRQQLIKQLEQKRAVEDAITKQKLQSYQQQLLEKRKQMHQLAQLNSKYQFQIKQLQQDLSKLKHEYDNFEQENNRLKQQNKQKTEKLIQMYQKIDNCQKLIDEKSNSIEKLTKNIRDIEGKYMNERAKASSYGAQNEFLSMNLQSKQKYIDSLTKCSQENLKNIQNLQVGNKQLKNLVGSLDCEVWAGRANEEYLKERLIDAQERVFITEGFARYNDQKVQLMKNDLRQLKMTL